MPYRSTLVTIVLAHAVSRFPQVAPERNQSLERHDASLLHTVHNSSRRQQNARAPDALQLQQQLRWHVAAGAAHLHAWQQSLGASMARPGGSHGSRWAPQS